MPKSDLSLYIHPLLMTQEGIEEEDGIRGFMDWEQCA